MFLSYRKNIEQKKSRSLREPRKITFYQHFNKKMSKRILILLDFFIGFHLQENYLNLFKLYSVHTTLLLQCGVSNGMIVLIKTEPFSMQTGEITNMDSPLFQLLIGRLSNLNAQIPLTL